MTSHDCVLVSVSPFLTRHFLAANMHVTPDNQAEAISITFSAAHFPSEISPLGMYPLDTDLCFLFRYGPGAFGERCPLKCLSMLLRPSITCDRGLESQSYKN